MAKPTKTLEELRETGRKRVERFHQAQEAKGRKQISGFISEQAYDALCRIRDKTGKSAGQIIETLLLESINKTVNINAGKKEVISPAKPKPPEKQKRKSVPVKERKRERARALREEMKLKIFKLRTEQGLRFTEIRDVLNAEGVPCPSGDVWNSATPQRLFKEYVEDMASK